MKYIYIRRRRANFFAAIKAIEERKSQQNIFDFGYLCFGVCIDFSNMQNSNDKQNSIDQQTYKLGSLNGSLNNLTEVSPNELV